LKRGFIAPQAAVLRKKTLNGEGETSNSKRHREEIWAETFTAIKEGGGRLLRARQEKGDQPPDHKDDVAKKPSKEEE